MKLQGMPLIACLQAFCEGWHEGVEASTAKKEISPQPPADIKVMLYSVLAAVAHHS